MNSYENSRVREHRLTSDGRDRAGPGMTCETLASALRDTVYVTQVLSGKVFSIWSYRERTKEKGSLGFKVRNVGLGYTI